MHWIGIVALTIIGISLAPYILGFLVILITLLAAAPLVLIAAICSMFSDRR